MCHLIIVVVVAIVVLDRNLNSRGIEKRGFASNCWETVIAIICWIVVWKKQATKDFKFQARIQDFGQGGQGGPETEIW